MVDFEKIANSIEEGYSAERATSFDRDFTLPDLKEVTTMIKEIRKLFFPAYFSANDVKGEPSNFARPLLATIYYRLKKQLVAALSFATAPEKSAEEIADVFLSALPEIQRVLMTDAQAALEGDPAAKTKEEIIVSYPGFYAIFVYRLAHVLYEQKVPFIPRMMTEYAHSKTGIDINCFLK